MAATPITKAKPFYAGGVHRTYWVPVIADTLLVPTRAELDAGDDVTPQLENLSGWTEAAAFTDVFNLDSRRGQKIAGRISIADSSLVFTTDKDGEYNVEDLLGWEEDVDGFVVHLDHGDVPGTPMRVFATSIGSISKDPSGDHTMTTVSFGIQKSRIKVPVPAAG